MYFNLVFNLNSMQLHTGTEVLTSDQKSVVCKLCVIGCTVDLVARAPILNMSQFNGLYGCPKCLQKGTILSVA